MTAAAQATGRPRRSAGAFRFVQIALLAGLLWKVTFFYQATQVYQLWPLRQPFFPDWLRAAETFAAAYLVAVLSIAATIVLPTGRLRQGFSWLSLAAISLLCLHQGSYNDATFTTAWWTALWSAWLAGRLTWLSSRSAATTVGAPPAELLDERLYAQASRLAAAIVSLILLGGAVGKWTQEYWSGQALYEIYFVDRDYWLFNSLRSSSSAGGLRSIATWYSRAVVVIETACGLALWLLPPRIAAMIGVVVLTSIALASNLYLFSVLLGPIALASINFGARPAWRW